MARFVRIAVFVVVVAALIWLLFTTVFPWIESYMENPSIGMTVPAFGAAPKAAVFS